MTLGRWRMSGGNVPVSRRPSGNGVEGLLPHSANWCSRPKAEMASTEKRSLNMVDTCRRLERRVGLHRWSFTTATASEGSAVLVTRSMLKTSWRNEEMSAFADLSSSRPRFFDVLRFKPKK